MNQLKDIKCFCLDMDGTVYLSDVLFKGALEAVERMQKQGRILFLTNNSSRTKNEYYKKLIGLGFNISLGDIYGSANATIDYLNAKHSGKRVYLLGCKSLQNEFAEASICLCNNDFENSFDDELIGKIIGCDDHFIDKFDDSIDGFYCEPNDRLSDSFKGGFNNFADVAVLAFDKTLTYKKLQILCRHLLNGAFFVATHPDKTCPTTGGDIPDVGSFLRLIKCATGRSPDVICGKPSKEYGKQILSLTGLKPAEIAMIGDRLSTDMRLAYNCGFKSVLVLSGESKVSDLDYLKKNGKRQPDIVLDSISNWDTI